MRLPCTLGCLKHARLVPAGWRSGKAASGEECKEWQHAAELAQKEAQAAEKGRRSAEQRMVRTGELGLYRVAANAFIFRLLHAVDGGYFMLQGALSAKIKELEKDGKFYKEVNAQLELNQAALEKARRDAEDSGRLKGEERDARIKDLEEQVMLASCSHWSAGVSSIAAIS